MQVVLALRKVFPFHIRFWNLGICSQKKMDRTGEEVPLANLGVEIIPGMGVMMGVMMETEHLRVLMGLRLRSC